MWAAASGRRSRRSEPCIRSIVSGSPSARSSRRRSSPRERATSAMPAREAKRSLPISWPGQAAVEEQRHPGRGGLGKGHPSRLGHEQVRRGQQRAHVLDVARHAHRAAGGQAGEPRAQPLVPARHHHRLHGPLDGEERVDDVGEPAERALGARHRDHRGQPRGETERAAGLGRLDRAREFLAHRDSGDHHAVGRDSPRHELVPHLLGGHAVAVHRARHPLAVGHEVGHRGGVGRQRATGGGERGHRGGGRGVDGHHRVRPHRVEQQPEPRHAEPRHAEGQRRLRPHPVTERVAERPQRGSPAQQPVVDRAARAREDRVHQVAEVVDHHGLGAAAHEGGGQAARGLRVAGAVARAQDEDAHGQSAIGSST